MKEFKRPGAKEEKTKSHDDELKKMATVMTQKPTFSTFALFCLGLFHFFENFCYFLTLLFLQPYPQSEGLAILFELLWGGSPHMRII